MSNSIASEISPAIRRAGRLTTNSAWQPSISAFGSARSPRRPANTVRRRSPKSTVSLTSLLEVGTSSTLSINPVRMSTFSRWSIVISGLIGAGMKPVMDFAPSNRLLPPGRARAETAMAVILRRQRDQARVPNSAGAADAEFSRKLERGADRLPARRLLRHQGRAAESRHAALGPAPLLGQGYQRRFRQHQR